MSRSYNFDLTSDQGCTAASLQLQALLSLLLFPQDTEEGTTEQKKEKKRKEKFTLFSDHTGSLLRRQPGAMTIGHSVF